MGVAATVSAQPNQTRGSIMSPPPEMLSVTIHETKMMFWALALAWAISSTAKIISCINNLFFHGLPSKLLQLFYFNIPRYTTSGVNQYNFVHNLHRRKPV
jgi:hypothetical protein